MWIKFLFVFILHSISVNGQTKAFFLTIAESSNWKVDIDTISETEFDGSKAFHYKENITNKDSLLKSITNQFPDKIILKDSCCTLKGFDKDIIVCQQLSASNNQQHQGFAVHSFEYGYLIIMKWAYETWYYISFNPVTQKYFFSPHVPSFINDDVAYSYGNYYGEGQFQVVDVRRGRTFAFNTSIWELTRLYRQGTKFFMEFKSNLQAQKKYLRIDYNVK